MQLSKLPPEWREGLKHVLDPVSFLVFADWLEEQNKIELADAIRWLVKKNRMPYQLPPLNKRKLISYRWSFPGQPGKHPESAELMPDIYELLPYKERPPEIRFLDGNPLNQTANNILLLHPMTHDVVPGFPNVECKWIKSFRSVLGAYLAAAGALLKVKKKMKERVSGAIPNWLTGYV